MTHQNIILPDQFAVLVLKSSAPADGGWFYLISKSFTCKRWFKNIGFTHKFIKMPNYPFTIVDPLAAV
jgi:hypothetical protein